jgi:inositol-phosphate phosphatase / L-galactose 1-phosphate phosphatase
VTAQETENRSSMRTRNACYVFQKAGYASCDFVRILKAAKLTWHRTDIMLCYSSSTSRRSESQLLLLLLTVGVGVGVYFLQNRYKKEQNSKGREVTWEDEEEPVEDDKEEQTREVKEEQISNGNTNQIPAELQLCKFARELEVAVSLALRAGAKMYSYCNEKGTAAESQHDLGISEKGQAEDFFTKVDIENEKLVTDGLLQYFPTHRVIGEEATGGGEVPRLTRAPTWIVDPIDGTTNFAAGLPLCCVSIGFCMNGKPVLGVVYAPMTAELYVAVSGCGAFRNGVRLCQRSSKTLKESVVGFEFGYAREKVAIDEMVEALRRILRHGCRTTRSLGSGVLDLCYVASGRLDVVYAGVATEAWKPWDLCAGVVVAAEAGCAVEAIDQMSGADFDIYSDSVICAASASLLRKTRKCIMT